MKFESVRIADLISEISMGPFGSNIKVECFVDKGIPVLNGSNLDGFVLKETSFRYVTEEKADSLGRANVHSVKEYGVLTPAIVRPREKGGYEIVAGHRRKRACELAGLTALPDLVRNLDDDTATILMLDSNIQRENILPSERAQAYKMKLESIKRRAGRRTREAADNSPNNSANFRSDDEIGAAMGMSGDTVRYYISLTQLVPELQQMVDDKKIAVTPAYQIAALKPEEQALLVKSKLLYLQDFQSIEHFKHELIAYLDYYNNRRIKVKRKGLPPALHRQQALSAA